MDGEIEALRRQLAERPRDAAAQRQLGQLLLQQGRPASAVQSLRAALDLEPRDLQASLGLATALIELGQHDAAVAVGERAVAALPGEPHAYLLQASILRRLDRGAAACEACRRAVEIAPDSALALNSLAASLIELDRLEEAEPLLERALAAEPGFQPARRNLGGLLKRLGRAEAAEAAFRACLAATPEPRLQAELGAVLLHQGRLEEARAAFESATAGDPDCVEARLGLGHLTLLQGDYATGLPLLAWGARLRPAPARFPQPLWRGEAIAGATILLHAEQGFGDCIQFLRYVPEVAARAGRVVLLVQNELRRLLEPTHGAWLARSSADLAACTLRAPLENLALLCGSRPDSIPQPPYLAADRQAVAAWRGKLGSSDGRRSVGLVWGGNAQNRNDRMRSLTPDLLAPLAAIPGVRWVNLQIGRAEAAPLADMLDPTPDLKDFADTAALLSALDLVLSVETAVAHLAGALARPGWVMLPFLPDWRWHIGGARSPWYPSLLLFRQDEGRRWETVVEAVAKALAAGEA